MSKSLYVLGVDVAKATLSVCLMRQSDRAVLAECTLDNSEEKIRDFLADIEKDILKNLCVAVEPTGTYWYLIADLSLASDCKVVCAQPRYAKKFLQSLNPRVKNDRLDAKGIALYALSMDLNEYQPKSESVTELEELLSLRRKVSETVAYYKQFAKSSRAGADLAERFMASHKEMIADLDRRLRQALHAFEPAKRLVKVPGFGDVTTAALVARLTSIDFKNSDAFVAYVGLDLKVQESGEYRGRRRLSHNGDAELRRLLYLAAQSTIRSKGSPFAQIYQRHTAPERGLASTEAICVVARKLARTAWSMVKYNTEYNPARVFNDVRA